MLDDEEELRSRLERMHEEAAQTEERCTELAGAEDPDAIAA